MPDKPVNQIKKKETAPDVVTKADIEAKMKEKGMKPVKK